MGETWQLAVNCTYFSPVGKSALDGDFPNSSVPKSRLGFDPYMFRCYNTGNVLGEQALQDDNQGGICDESRPDTGGPQN